MPYESEFETSEGIRTFQRKLLLPLSDDGERVNMILVGLYFDRANQQAARFVTRRAVRRRAGSPWTGSGS
jgi:hypothetical protein